MFNRMGTHVDGLKFAGGKTTAGLARQVEANAEQSCRIVLSLPGETLTGTD